MDQTGGALAIVTTWLGVVLAFFVGIFGVIDGALRRALDQAGVPGNIQAIVILVATVLFIVAVLRLFGGLFRILLVLFLVLLALHVLLPGSV